MTRAASLAVCLAAGLATALPATSRDQEHFQVDAAASRIVVRVGRAGIFSFAGHDHEVAVPAMAGRVTVDRSDVSRSSIQLEFDAVALRVTGEGEPPEDVPEVQRVMLSDRVLDVQRYPAITFRSRRIALAERGADGMLLRIEGDLTLHGVTRPLAIPVHVHLTSDRLTAEGKTAVRQTEFGIRPVTAGAGTVRVRDQVEVFFRVIAEPL